MDGELVKQKRVVSATVKEFFTVSRRKIFPALPVT
jgi:hypothetical protein